MTEQQFEIAKKAYEQQNPGKLFESLGLSEMNSFLDELIESGGIGHGKIIDLWRD